MPELAEFAKQSLVQGLYAQRNALIETQQVAQKSLVELEARLATLQLSLPERIRAYEKRISELEKEVETQGEEMRELTRATLALVRKKLEAERARRTHPQPFQLSERRRGVPPFLKTAHTRRQCPLGRIHGQDWDASTSS